MSDEDIKKFAGGWSKLERTQSNLLEIGAVSSVPAYFDNCTYVALDTAAGCLIFPGNLGIEELAYSQKVVFVIDAELNTIA